VLLDANYLPSAARLRLFTSTGSVTDARDEKSAHSSSHRSSRRGELGGICTHTRGTRERTERGWWEVLAVAEFKLDWKREKWIPPCRPGGTASPYLTCGRLNLRRLMAERRRGNIVHRIRHSSSLSRGVQTREQQQHTYIHMIYRTNYIDAPHGYTCIIMYYRANSWPAMYTV
jgi:hypothetical protein